MPLFDYAGQLRSGQMFQGTLEADSPAHAEAVLVDMGVRVTSLRPARRTAYVAPLGLDDLLFLNEQLAAMAKAAIPLEEGLRALAADVGSRKLKRLLLDLAADLAAGLPLPQALEKHQGRFPVRYADVIRAGLRTGDLSGTLYGLSAHLRLKSQFRRALFELAAYPLIVIALALLVAAFFMRAIMPELERMAAEFYTDYDLEVPLSAQLTFGINHHWPTIERVLMGAVLLFVLLMALLRLPPTRSLRERLLRRVPGFARVYWSSVLARFAHTSALAAYSGTPLPELVASAGAASGSPALARASRGVAERLAQGQPLAAATKDVRDLPELWTCVAATAADRGTLPEALQELARVYEERAAQWAAAVRTALGPLLLLLVGAILGGLILMVFTTLSSFYRGMSALTGF